MSKKSVAVTAIVAATIGIGLGSVGSASSDTVAEPKVKTVTKEVEAVPQACLDALSDAEGVADSVADFGQVSIQWPNLVVRAARAGLNRDVGSVRAIIADMESMTSDYDDITAELTPQVRSFNANKASCRSAG